MQRFSPTARMRRDISNAGVNPKQHTFAYVLAQYSPYCNGGTDYLPIYGSYGGIREYESKNPFAYTRRHTHQTDKYLFAGS